MSEKFDRSIKDKLSAYEAPYDAEDWADLERSLPLPGQSRWRRAALWFSAAALVGLGLGIWWLWPDGSTEQLSSGGVSSPVQVQESPFDEPASGAHSGSLMPDGSKGVFGSGPAADGLDAGAARESKAVSTGSKDAGSTAALPPKKEMANPTGGAASEPAKTSQAPQQRQGSAPSNTSAAAQASAAKPPTSPAQTAAQTPSNVAALPLAQAPPNAAAPPSAQEPPNAADPPLARTPPTSPVQSISSAKPGAQVPLSLHPAPTILASGYNPGDFERLEPDPTLRKQGKPLQWALYGAVGMNAEYTGPGDGFSPGYDMGLGAELWLRQGLFLSAGLRFGEYHFHQNQVACGNPRAYGIKEPVHCPDAMLSEQLRWEAPVHVGYGWDFERIRGRMRVAAGVVARWVEQEQFTVQYKNPQPGVLLFYAPVTIAVAANDLDLLSFDAHNLVENSQQNTVQPLGPGTDPIAPKLSWGGELSFGYEQFLAPGISLGIEPRFGMAFSTLPVSEGRAYYGAASARLRWYPGMGMRMGR